MKLIKILPLLLIVYSCQAPKFNFGEASNYLPSEKLLQEGIVNKYYFHEKKHDSQDVGTHIEYRSYTVENNKLLQRRFDPAFRLKSSKAFSFKNNQMILLNDILYSEKDTFLVSISNPIEKDWASQHSTLEKIIFSNDDWKLEFSAKQERNVDTIFLNKRSKLFEGNVNRINSNGKDTFIINRNYKEIYTENLGLSHAEWVDSTTRYWIELVEQIPLKLFKKQAKHGLQRVAYINPNDALDKNEYFELCEINDHIYDYYNGGAKLLYKGGKKAMWEILNQQLKTENLFNESGYLTFRFIVNCKGEAGRFITEEANLNYKKKIFDTATTSHFYKIIKEMNDWIPTKIKGENVDAYFYLTFKLKDGELIELLP